MSKNNSQIEDNERTSFLIRIEDTLPNLDVQIDISLRALAEIKKHASENLEYEVGGFLLGSYDILQEGFAQSIYHILPQTSIRAKHTINARTSLTFTLETSDAMQNDINAMGNQNLKLLGWYHTHLGAGAFLSSLDKDLHKTFFSDPYKIALVIDPVKNEHVFFAWNMKHEIALVENKKIKVAP